MGARESVDIVDEKDAVIGRATLRKCLEQGLLHRAVAVIVARPGGKILLQKRSMGDSWHPGLWTLSCTGHVKRGETYESAATRELKEELSLEANLTPVGKRLLPPFTEGALTEREWVAVFTAASEGAVTPDPMEVESAREFSQSDIKVLASRNELTPDAVIILDEFVP